MINHGSSKSHSRICTTQFAVANVSSRHMMSHALVNLPELVAQGHSMSAVHQRCPDVVMCPLPSLLTLHLRHAGAFAIAQRKR